MPTAIRFVIDYFCYAFTGSKLYYLWLLLLVLFMAPWLYGSYQQLTVGMGLTGLSDQVSWGIYTANFVFLVGVAAAAVIVIFPAYVYNCKPLKDVAVLGEILAVCAVFMCLLFILLHMGRPDRLWHMLPGVGIFSFPHAMLAWDTLVLLGYLVVNLVAASYVLYWRYTGRAINRKYYLPLIGLSIIWAISIHTVTAFLLNTLPARPMWHHGALPIRFIATAFAAGPAMIIVVLLIVRNKTRLWVDDSAINLLSTIMLASLTLALFLSFSEIVTALYHPTEHSAGLRYLMFGYQGFNDLVPWFWASMLATITAWLCLLVPQVRKNTALLPFLCVLVFFGTWAEKGMGLIVPGSIPSPIGEYSTYTPSLIEIFNSLGSWAVGLFLLTILLKGAIGVLLGDLKYTRQTAVQEPTIA